MSNYKYIDVEIKVDLDNWSEDELREELEERGESGGDEQLREIHQMIKLGKKDAAYAAMYDYIRNKLGVAI